MSCQPPDDPEESGFLYFGFQLSNDPDFILLTITAYDIPDFESYCKLMNVHDGTVSDVVSCDLDTREWPTGDIDPSSTSIISAVDNGNGTANIILSRNNQNVTINEIPYNSSGTSSNLYYDQFTLSSINTTFILLSPYQYTVEIVRITFKSESDNSVPNVLNLGDASDSLFYWEVEQRVANMIPVYESAHSMRLPMVCCGSCYVNFIVRYDFYYDEFEYIAGILMDKQISGVIVDDLGQKAYDEWYPYRTYISVYDLSHVGGESNQFTPDLSYTTTSSTNNPTTTPTYTALFTTDNPTTSTPFATLPTTDNPTTSTPFATLAMTSNPTTIPTYATLSTAPTYTALSTTNNSTTALSHTIPSAINNLNTTETYLSTQYYNEYNTTLAPTNEPVPTTDQPTVNPITTTDFTMHSMADTTAYLNNDATTTESTTNPTLQHEIIYGICITITLGIEVDPKEEPTNIQDIIPEILTNIMDDQVPDGDDCDNEDDDYNIQIQDDDEETIIINATIFLCNQKRQQTLIAYLSDENTFKTDFISSINNHNETNLIILPNEFKWSVDPITLYPDDSIEINPTITTNVPTLCHPEDDHDRIMDLLFLLIIICIAMMIYIMDLVYIRRCDCLHFKNILLFALCICNLITDVIISYQLSWYYLKHDYHLIMITIIANVSLLIAYLYNNILGTVKVYLIRSHLCCLFSCLLLVISGDLYNTLQLLSCNLFNINTMNTMSTFKLRQIKTITILIYNIPQIIVQSIFMAMILQSLNWLFIVSIALSLINVIPYLSLMYLSIKSFRFVIVQYILSIVSISQIPTNKNTSSNLYILTKQFANVLNISASKIQITSIKDSKIHISHQIEKKQTVNTNKYIRSLYKNKNSGIDRCIKKVYGLHCRIQTQLRLSVDDRDNTASTVPSIAELQVVIPGHVRRTFTTRRIDTHSPHSNHSNHTEQYAHIVRGSHVHPDDIENDELYDLFPNRKSTVTHTGTSDPITPMEAHTVDNDDNASKSIMYRHYRVVNPDENKDLPPSPKSGEDILSDVFKTKGLGQKKLNEINMNESESDNSDSMYEKKDKCWIWECD